MSGSLWIGTTGLSASAKQLEVIGNNLANTNTVGFKAADTYFASMLSQTLGGGTAQIGQGVGVQSISTQFAQGSFEATGNVTDLSIDGNGFFIVKDRDGLLYYTRAGNFRIQQDQRLTDFNKYALQGYLYDAEGKVEITKLQDITFRDIKSSPVSSTFFRIGANLDSRVSAGAEFNAAQNVYDTRGDVKSLNINFKRTADSNYWGITADLSGQQARPMTFNGFKFNLLGNIDQVYTSAIKNKSITSGSITDLNLGQLYQDTTTAITLSKDVGLDSPWSITGNGGYTNLHIVSQSREEVILSMGAPGSRDIRLYNVGGWAGAATASFEVEVEELTLRNNEITFEGISIGQGGRITWDLTSAEAPSLNNFASAFRINSLYSDGYPSGSLSSIDIDKNGLINGFFTNGQQQPLAQLILADFKSPTGLRKLGSYFLETTESGKPTWNRPGVAGSGSIQANALEMSNTDVAREFIKMITAQRAYQASARMITAADQMQQELMNIKR